MPTLSNVSINMTGGISGTVGKSVTGSDYSGPSQAANIQRAFQFTSNNANNASLGADEFVSYLLSIAAGSSAIVDLTSLIDFLLQSGVSLARIKGVVANLLSTTQDATYGTLCTSVVLNGPVPAPVQAALSSSASGGSIGAGTYNYVITALTAAGETVVSNEKITSTLSGSTNSVTLNWAAVPNATGYKIYRSTTPGTYGASTLVTTIGSGATITYTDTAAATSSGTPPTINTAVPPNMFLLNSSNPTSDRVLYNGDVESYATPLATGLVVGSTTKLYVYNKDATHAAALQLTFVGGTT